MTLQGRRQRAGKAVAKDFDPGKVGTRPSRARGTGTRGDSVLLEVIWAQMHPRHVFARALIASPGRLCGQPVGGDSGVREHTSLDGER
jgi:hypothetical protein